MKCFTMDVEKFRKVLHKMVDNMDLQSLLHVYDSTTLESGAYEFDPDTVVIEIYEPNGSDEQEITEYLKEINNG